ncbi:oxidoreductase [Paraburkholderia aspalathi]|uniref:oxidoreductase n=1 Tax=Paraburkholderia aspalathi TaxID=1324617 RepID=UPI001FD4B08D|nr:oxidoreductase [Paraburkholderia aspalathi]
MQDIDHINLPNNTRSVVSWAIPNRLTDARMQKTWFITGAGRGLGLEITQAALQAGDRVVATSRRREALTAVLGQDSQHMMTVALDVSDAGQARAAVDLAITRFGGIDVLVNNAGYGHMGFFEELTIDDTRAQFETNVFGAFNVTWATLPVMRSARKGRIFNVSSLGGLLGGQMGSIYCASKFALEGFSEALDKEVSPFGISVIIVEPGPFRTDFLAPESLQFGQNPISDYDERRADLTTGMAQRNGKQPGDPARLASALISLASEAAPPKRFLAGSIAVEAADAKLVGMRDELASWRHLSTSTDGDFSSSDVVGLLAQIK